MILLDKRVSIGQPLTQGSCKSLKNGAPGEIRLPTTWFVGTIAEVYYQPIQLLAVLAYSIPHST